MTKKGMTLVELIVVLAIIVVFLGLGRIGLHMLDEHKEKTFVKELYLDLENLRQTALFEQKKLYFNITAAQKYQMYEQVQGEKVILDSVELPSSLHFVMNQSAKEIYFGMSFSQVKAGTLRLESDLGNEYVITIVPVTGRIYLK